MPEPRRFESGLAQSGLTQSGLPQPGLAKSESAESRGPGEWVSVCAADQVPRDGGASALIDDTQIAIFHIADRGEWFAVQNRCPHWNEMVLSRAMTGEDLEGDSGDSSEGRDGEAGSPCASAGNLHIACPMHKRKFSLATGECLSDDLPSLRTFAVRVVDGVVEVQRPEAEFIAAEAALLEADQHPAGGA